MADRSSWAGVPEIYVEIPPPPPAALCPCCDSESYTRIRTEAGGDGSFTQKRICRECGERYLAVFEISARAGNGEEATPYTSSNQSPESQT